MRKILIVLTALALAGLLRQLDEIARKPRRRKP